MPTICLVRNFCGCLYIRAINWIYRIKLEPKSKEWRRIEYERLKTNKNTLKAKSFVGTFISITPLHICSIPGYIICRVEVVVGLLKARADWLAWLFPNTSVHNCFGYFSCTPKSRQHFSIEKKNYSRETEPNRTKHSADSVLGGEGSSVRRSDRHEIISNVADDKS